MKICKQLSGFDVGQFLYTNCHPVDHPAAKRVDFTELITESDFILICCALTDATKGLFNNQTFVKMKNTAILVNTSRGPVIDMDDLAEALENNQIAAAGLDVTVPEPMPLDHKLLKLPNCVILPHIGSATNEARSAMSELTAKNIIAALKDQPMPAEVN